MSSVLEKADKHIELDRRFCNLTDQGRESSELIASLDNNDLSFDFPWNELLKKQRVFILAEGGSGKTSEMQAQKKRLTSEGYFAFFIPLDELGQKKVCDCLSLEERRKFNSWLPDKNQKAYFFLDAVDELRLVGGKLGMALKEVARALDNACTRAHIFVSCRRTDWRPEKDMQDFQEALPLPIIELLSPPQLTGNEAFLAPFRQAQEKKREKQSVERFHCVLLQRLNKSQIEKFAVAEGVADSKALLTEINRRQAWPFVRRPLDLKRIITTWKAKRTLNSLRQQHEDDVKASLDDSHNLDRRDRGILSMERAIDGVERLALAMLLTRTYTIKVPGQPIENAALDAANILRDWNLNEIEALLRRSIFDPATYGRVRFHHRSIQEFLAACRLKKLCEVGLSKQQLCQILFADTYDEHIVIPSRRPIAAWLSKDNDDIRQEILRREPEVLMLYGDPETLPLPVRIKLIRNYVDTYANGTSRGLSMPIAEMQRFASPDLSPEIKRYWNQRLRNEEMQKFLLKLIWLGEIQDCVKIAFEATMNASLEDNTRIIGARAVGACNRRDLLEKIYDDILTHPQCWSDRLLYSLVNELFPNVISTEGLTQLIRRTHEPNKGTIIDFSCALYDLAERLEPDDNATISLRDALCDLVLEGKKVTERWDNLVSKYSYLTPALAKLCQKRLSLNGSADRKWIHASVIVNRFHNENTLGREDIAQLSRVFKKQLRYRETVFWEEVDFENIMNSEINIDHHLSYIQRHSLLGHIVADDWSWLIDGLQKKNLLSKRNIALHALTTLWIQQGRSDTELKTLKKAMKDNQDLVKTLIARTTPPQPMHELKENQVYYKDQTDAQQKIEQSWLDWKAKAEANPAACFKGENRDKTRWTLTTWLRYKRENTTLTCSRWMEIRSGFGGVMGELFEQDLQKYWRKTEPPIWSRRSPQDHNVIYGVQYMALTGLAIEAAKNPAWASALSRIDAKRAAEWGLTELNGFPEWYVDLANAQPEAVKNALITELKVELKNVLVLSHPQVLSMIQNGDNRLKKLVFSYLKTILLKWPCPPIKQAEENIYNQNLTRVLSVITAEISLTDDIVQLCEERFLNTLDHSAAVIWLHGLLSCNPGLGIKALSEGVKALPEATRKIRTLEWFGEIFGDYSWFNLQQLSSNIDVELLISLTKLVYEYVRCEDDKQHEGIYTPDLRDRAERARNRIIETLIEKSGLDAHNALITLADDPLFAHISDRLRLTAREKAAKESEPLALSPAEYRKWEESYEICSKNRDELFQVVLNRLDDIEFDLRNHDFSCRDTLKKIKYESEMQKFLARELQNTARGQYIVSREEEVADKKETDIRLSSTNSNDRCVIEIKIGENWSAVKLQKALETQLVGKYLRHETCTAGFLLITYAKHKKERLKDPDTGKFKLMGIEQVIERLKQHASALENAENGRIKLGIFFLDLRDA